MKSDGHFIDKAGSAALIKKKKTPPIETPASGGFDDGTTSRHYGETSGRDSDGENFNPAIHAANANGDPILTLKGRFRKRVGRKPINARPALNIPGSTTQNYDDYPEAAPQPPSNSAAAQAAAEIYIQTGVAIFGHEWLPDEGARERDNLVSAFNVYLGAKGITDIPPGVALFIAMFGYAAPRLYLPKTQTKIQRFTLWCRLKIGALKLKRSPVQPNEEKSNGTRNDFRPNGVRENDTGEVAPTP